MTTHPSHRSTSSAPTPVERPTVTHAPTPSINHTAAFSSLQSLSPQDRKRLQVLVQRYRVRGDTTLRPMADVAYDLRTRHGLDVSVREVYDLLNWSGESGAEGEAGEPEETDGDEGGSTEEPAEPDEGEKAGELVEAEPGSGGTDLEPSEPVMSERGSLTLAPAEPEPGESDRTDSDTGPTDPDPRDDDDLAVELALLARLAAVVLNEHINEDGLCAACPGVVFPCELAVVAEHNAALL